MRKGTASIVLQAVEAIETKSKSEAPAPALGPLVRLRQIVEELRAAANRNDLVVVQAAAALLGPTAARCLEARHAHPESAREAAEIAKQIEAALLECETILTATRLSVTTQMKRVQNGKRAVAQARDSRSAPPPRHNRSN